MSTAAVVLIIIGFLVLTLNVFCVCDTWEKIAMMEIGELSENDRIKKLISELKDQRLTETGDVDYSRYFNEGINLAIDIAERYEYEKEFK
jgi:hypothetical protein